MTKKRLLLLILIVLALLVYGCAQDFSVTEEIPEKPQVIEDVLEIEELPEPQPTEEIEAIEKEGITLPVEPGSLVHDVKEPEIELFNPKLTYTDAYNGPLYATSEQVGNSAPMNLYFEDMDRNGVNFIIGFFAVQDQPDEKVLISSEGLGYMIDAVQRHPNRIIPFFSPGFGSSETKPLLGDKLTNVYKNNLEASKAILGDNIIKGFGEIEQYAWNIQPNDAKLLSLFDLASSNGLFVMFHPLPNQKNAIKDVLKKYPNTIFFIHMFPEDFEKDRSNIIELMKTHDNLYFSIDTDHMLYDGRTGLLYKYQDENLNSAKSGFISDFDRLHKSMLNTAVSRYKPLVDAVPDKVFWGNEMGPRYNYEPEVYDRMIKFTRLFIGKLNPEDQEKVAYKNALRVFGQGVKLDKDINTLKVVDTISWSVCTKQQEGKCDSECEQFGPETSPENEACYVSCLTKLKCVESG